MLFSFRDGKHRQICELRDHGRFGVEAQFLIDMQAPSPVLVAVALKRKAIIQWTTLRTRIAAVAYIMGAATLGALAHYQPFDVVIMNGEVIGPTHPAYEVALVAAPVFAAVPFAIGWVAERRARTVGADALRATPMDSGGTS